MGTHRPGAPRIRKEINKTFWGFLLKNTVFSNIKISFSKKKLERSGHQNKERLKSLIGRCGIHIGKSTRLEGNFQSPATVAKGVEEPVGLVPI